MIDTQKSLESEIVSINEFTEILKQIYTDKLTSFLVIKKIENIPVFSWLKQMEILGMKAKDFIMIISIWLSGFMKVKILDLILEQLKT